MNLNFFFFLISIGSGLSLNCTSIPQSDQVAGKQLSVPNGAAMPVLLPANFNCIYTISPPLMVYAKVQVENKLKGVNDVIIVRDTLGKSTIINSKSNFITLFTVFPNTITTIQVTTKSVQMNSMFLLNISFEKMPTPISRLLETGTNTMNYRILNETQIELSGRQLVTYQTTDRITVTLANSLNRDDIFNNFYVVDGDFHYPTVIQRVSDFNQCGNQCYRSQTSTVTIVGLDEYTDESSVILMSTSESEVYDEVTAMTLYDSENYFDVSNRTVNFGSKTSNVAYVILSKDSDGIVILNFEFTQTTPGMVAKAVAGPPNSASKSYCLILSLQKKNMLIYSISFTFLLVFSIFWGLSEELDCTQVPVNDQSAGKVLYIPDNQNTSVLLPSNFNCSYVINPPKLTYAQITVTNNLKGVNDIIIVTDGQQKTTKVNRNNPSTVVFYVFPQTSTTVDVQSFDDTSRFQMTVSYIALPAPQQRALQKGQNLNYLSLSSIQRKPLSLSGDGTITLTIAKSDYNYDVFTNYFVIDGDMNNPRSIRRLDDFTLSNFNTSSNVITVVGLDDAVSHSSIILTPSSDLAGFTKFAGVSVDGSSGNVLVSATYGQKIGIIIIAKDIQQLVLDKMKIGESSSCSSIAVTGSPTADSKTLMNFHTDQYTLPQLFPYPYLSIIVENCDVQFNFTTSLPPNYYQLDSDRSGFIYSPIFFNSETTNGYVNLTFVYTGDEKKQFVVDVDRAMLTSNSELDINIYDSDWRKTLSTVITGNQEGTRSRAFGSYLNVQMSGYTSAKLHWQLSSSIGSVFGIHSITLIVALILMISY
ncbi:hypothetical protein GCK72_013767 [Caenorhabditis remanei]|uniref:CUB-like domain-containing protein n=1 Tax=Caenorhabditis remanei TaxID=31234 RepID=A0A6A5GSH9_CAERE|nr:hypothetical protein GCK72_013767 [Caenorhabditis remanei]KAF1757312.1 hypothetical protein GCK72_013767 [Caenorhabditis remanei]